MTLVCTCNSCLTSVIASLSSPITLACNASAPCFAKNPCNCGLSGFALAGVAGAGGPRGLSGGCGGKGHGWTKVLAAGAMASGDVIGGLAAGA